MNIASLKYIHKNMTENVFFFLKGRLQIHVLKRGIGNTCNMIGSVKFVIQDQ